MNLKEIGVLLLGIYGVTTLLIFYKYYLAKAGVFRVSRILIIRYFLRLLLLMAFLFLCFYSIQVKQSTSNRTTSSPVTLIGISANSSSMAWQSLQEKSRQLPNNRKYALIVYSESGHSWQQVIPATNYDSFVHLIEQGSTKNLNNRKFIFKENIKQVPEKDQILEFTMIKDQWEVNSSSNKELSTLSNSIVNGWIGSSYLKLYLVVLILVILFLEIVFTSKAIKI
jgi:hypothetical protein